MILMTQRQNSFNGDIKLVNHFTGTSKDAMASSTESKALKESKEEPAKEELSLEERARAVEMGLRIGLINDEETEKKYLEVFLVCI